MRGDAFHVVKSRILAAYPALSNAPWAHLEKAVAEIASPTPIALAAALPPPPPPFGEDLDGPMIPIWAKRLADQAERRAKRSKTGAFHLAAAWRFVRREPKHTAFGLMGLLCLLPALGFLSAEARKGEQRDAAYEAVVVAATMHDVEAMASPARTFLSLTPKETFDYRTIDVIELYSAVLLREIADAAEGGRPDDVARLRTEAMKLEERAKAEEQAWSESEEDKEEAE
jgi:hypothetical protein